MADSNYDSFLKESGDFKKAAKEFWRCLRDAPAKAKTPSGKIEIFSETIHGFGYDDCPGHPAWIEPAEWLGAGKAASLARTIDARGPMPIDTQKLAGRTLDLSFQDLGDLFWTLGLRTSARKAAHDRRANAFRAARDEGAAAVQPPDSPDPVPAPVG